MIEPQKLSARALLTLVRVNPHDDDDLVPSDSNELLYRSDTSSGQLGQQDHSLNVVVFELMTRNNDIRLH